MDGDADQLSDWHSEGCEVGRRCVCVKVVLWRSFIDMRALEAFVRTEHLWTSRKAMAHDSTNKGLTALHA